MAGLFVDGPVGDFTRLVFEVNRKYPWLSLSVGRDQLSFRDIFRVQVKASSEFRVQPGYELEDIGFMLSQTISSLQHDAIGGLDMQEHFEEEWADKLREEKLTLIQDIRDALRKRVGARNYDGVLDDAFYQVLYAKK